MTLAKTYHGSIVMQEVVKATHRRKAYCNHVGLSFLIAMFHCLSNALHSSIGQNI